MTVGTRKLIERESEMHESASVETGLHDFGDPSYRDALQALAHALDTDLELSETGREFVYNFYLRGPLIARLYAEKGWAAHPEALAAPIKQPLIVIGTLRSGTTALHKLLSMDTQFQGLEYYLAQRPTVRPVPESLEANALCQASEDTVRMIYAHMPGQAQMHDYDSRGVEECKFGMCQTFMRIELTNLLPSYRRWYHAQDRRHSYRRYADVLRLIGTREQEKRWLLKCPHHVLELDALLDVFPDARIVQIHRDPLISIPSMCSLWYGIEKALQENVRPDTIGPREAAFWREALDLGKKARLKAPGQFIDVYQRDLKADPLGTARHIYTKFGLELSPVVEQNMREWVETSPTNKISHMYGADEWGITQTQLRDVFADYRKEHHFTD